MTRKQISRKRKVKKNIENDVAHIRSTFNNTIVTVTGEFDNILSWSSTDALGPKGSKKSTLFTAQMASETASKPTTEHDLRTVEITIKGPGPGCESVTRVLQSAGLEVTTIRNIIPIPYDGCCPPKRRRV